MGIQEIFEREGIEVTEQDILAEMSSTAEQFEGLNNQFDPQKLREQIIETLKVDICIQLLALCGQLHDSSRQSGLRRSPATQYRETAQTHPSLQISGLPPAFAPVQYHEFAACLAWAVLQQVVWLLPVGQIERFAELEQQAETDTSLCHSDSSLLTH